MQGLDFIHHCFIDGQPAGRVHEHHVVIMTARMVQRGACDIDRLLVRGRREEIDACLTGNGLQLFDRRRAIDVGRHRQHFFLHPLAEQLAQLAGGGGLARALQTGHEYHRRRLGGKIEPDVGAAHELLEFIVHHADQGLARRKRPDDLLPERLFTHAGNEILDHRQGHVGLEQGHAHFAHRVLDVVFGEARLTAYGLDDL